MFKLRKTKLITLLLLAAAMVLAGLSCKFTTPALKEALKPVELTWWGTYDDPQNFAEVINDYRALHPHISVTYRKLRPEEFERELLNALAEDRGPDIFSLPNTWLTKYLPKIEPLPPKTKMAYVTSQKSLGLKEETITEIRESSSLTAPQLKDGYLDVVYQDVVRDGKIYGLPLSVDTLVLFYNRDLFNNAGLPLPPANWLDLQEQVKKLTYQDKNGNLIQSGAALGTGVNVDRGVDILSLLMMQNGAQMTVGGQVTFGLVPANFPTPNYNPGLEAIRFYTDFAAPAKEVYTWNETFPNSLDAFAQGRVAMIFGYNYHIPYLEAKRSGKLNYAIAKAPQIEGRPEINFANYRVQVVSKKSRYVNEAWDFLQFISRAAQARKYLAKTSQPAALRALVAEQQADDRLKIFADQLLTSTSWYRGRDALAMEKTFSEMIDLIRQGGGLREIIELTTQKIQQTFY
ncbi:MAG: hypothetical protein A2663_02865 [Candidatus Buchananbacteria bacterium RIFCSPHIGHO2_01_FULL_46_12]|uniref:ABC transporter substrate-binding protein n=3 Tax=Candidatus Buchananiibacteriota TaxID=1817903 RepID=A0A1G1Y0J8_9BACT|nr:MAG: hypothetical protein A2663_02865 [Candidatus Buchananbacteria bacterium RIFCSPHIGHO2_01_FULL_46_12]